MQPELRWKHLPTTTRRLPETPRPEPGQKSGPLTANQRERRARILDATRELVTRHGYDGMVMRDVAARAEVSATTLYNLYNTKDELLLAALRERITDSANAAAAQSNGPGYEYLLALVRNVCRETRSTPAYVAAIARALFRASSGDPLTEVLLAGLQADISQSLAAMTDKGQLDPAASTNHLATALAGSFWSVFLLWDKGLLNLGDLERAQLSGYLSILVPAAVGPARQELEVRYREISGREAMAPAELAATD